MSIALIGPSGAGKGTHIGPLRAKFGLLHLSPGDLFRANVQNQTALGIIAQKYMSRGELVPDEIVDAMIEEQLRKSDPTQPFLFDGFPATQEQAQFLDTLLSELGRTLEAVIYLDVENEIAAERITGRLICSHCQMPFHQSDHVFTSCPSQQCQGEHLYHRQTDTAELAQTRLNIFYRKAAGLVGYYQKQNKLIIIDANRSIDLVQESLSQTITAVKRQEALLASATKTIEIQSLRQILKDEPDQALQPSLDLVLLGGPGSGKGTQATRLSRQLNLPHISTGDLFRQHLKDNTELGKLTKSYMERGELVPDELTEAIVQERLTRPDTAVGFILDGFPRTRHQAEALTELLAQMGRRLSGVVTIKVSDEEIIKRLSERLVCSQCQTPYHLIFNPPAEADICDRCGHSLYQREDDRPETVKARLKTFHRQTEPLLNYYSQVKLLVEINGQDAIEAITNQALTVIATLEKDNRPA